MQVSKLLVSNLSITEDEYNFSGSFVLSNGNKTLNVGISDLELQEKLEVIKDFFSLDEDTTVIRNHLMSEIIDKSGISSRNNEGETYSVNPREYNKGDLDMA